MKTYEITLRHDDGKTTFRTIARDYRAAQEQICKAERAPLSAIMTWRVIPTARQIQKTKNLLRCL